MTKALIIGSPNSGKSLLFNKLTGLNHKVANFPGITVAASAGKAQGHPDLTLVDCPGVYSLNAISGEEQVAVAAFNNALQDPEVSTVICVLDSTRLEKGLFFTLQILDACHKTDKKVVVAANMIDVLDNHKLALDADGLAAALCCPVIAVSARNGQGVDQLIDAIDTPQQASSKAPSATIAVDDNGLRNKAESLAKSYGPKGDILITSQTKADSFFLHSLFGGLSFFFIMYLLFQSIFTWAAPVMDAVGDGLAWSADVVLPLISNTTAHDFVKDALFGGVGAFLVFVPQIFVLTLIVAFA